MAGAGQTTNVFTGNRDNYSHDFQNQINDYTGKANEQYNQYETDRSNAQNYENAYNEAFENRAEYGDLLDAAEGKYGVDAAKNTYQNSLRAIAATLGVSLSSLFVGEISNESLIRRRADQERIRNPNEKDALYYGLTPGPLKSNVELLLMSLAPDAETNPGFSQHFEEEIAYVAQGEAVILFEDEEFALSQGDTVRILPSRKHKFRNPGALPLKILFIKSKAAY